MLYEFKCSDCNHTFEVKRLMSDCGEPAVCPECGKEAQRVYSRLDWIWAGELFRPDGSRREQNDYASLKG